MNDPIEVSHIQKLNQEQAKYVNAVQWAFREKRRAFIAKDKAIQMIIDYCEKNNIKPEEFIK